MSVTFSGGITFTGGGFSFTAAPPAEATYGWFGGGMAAATALPPKAYVSSVQRIEYANDTTTASVRGSLTLARSEIAGTGNTNYGWFGAGFTYPPSVVRSTVDRITYATDTATASSRGPLLLATSFLAAAGTSTAGWWGGGRDPGSVSISTVQRITYATDTATASQRGPLYQSTGLGQFGLAATTDKTTYGWYAGGFAPAFSTVNRITYATDTGTSSVRGPLSAARYYLAGTGNSNYGYYAGGYPLTTSFQRITYATDTNTASVRGTLTYSSTALSATGNDTYGYFAGGYVPTPLFSQVDRITFATDTTTASSRGALATYLAWSSSSTNPVYA